MYSSPWPPIVETVLALRCSKGAPAHCGMSLVPGPSGCLEEGWKYLGARWWYVGYAKMGDDDAKVYLTDRRASKQRLTITFCRVLTLGLEYPKRGLSTIVFVKCQWYTKHNYVYLGHSTCAPVRLSVQEGGMRSSRGFWDNDLRFHWVRTLSYHVRSTKYRPRYGDIIILAG